MKAEGPLPPGASHAPAEDFALVETERTAAVFQDAWWLYSEALEELGHGTLRLFGGVADGAGQLTYGGGWRSIWFALFLTSFKLLFGPILSRLGSGQKIGAVRNLCSVPVVFRT